MAAYANTSAWRYFLTISVASITATGVYFGAGLKNDQEFKQVSKHAVRGFRRDNVDQILQERKAVLEASPAERIQQLEIAKARLQQQSNDLERKIDSLTNGLPSTTEDRGRQRR